MRKLFTLTVLFSLFAPPIMGQDLKKYRPKVGLTLSGGAAKGIAHISLLKTIDSLDIHIDYISGTSMGAIIGGLYAIGYSGKELEQLVKNEDWDLILSNQTYLKDIHIDEKSEYGRYLLEMSFVNNKIQLPSGINEGQNLMNLLHKLTARVAHIHDFNQFPIPFKCMTADIVSGEGIVLDTGDLAMAMRASMSIPTIFTPVDWGGDGLMVDGGLVHNFPVDLVCGMGADFVIGSYTGGRLYPKNQLNSLIRLLYQSASFQRASESIEQQKLCNILFSSDDALRQANLKVSDFNKNRRILAVGDSIVKQLLPQLQALADAQQQFDLESPKTDTSGRKRLTKNTLVSAEPIFYINNITLKGIDDYKKEVAYRYLKLRENDTFTIQHIQDAINHLYSSSMYKQVYYNISGERNNAQLVIHLDEKPQKAFKFGVHFDNELGSGIMVNWTTRDWIGQNSRFITAVDVAQSPKFRFHYRKRLKQSGWSSNLAMIYERTSESLIFDQQTLSNYRRQQNQLKGYMSRSLGQSAELGMGVIWNFTDYRPLYNINDKIYIRDKRPDSLSQLAVLQSSGFAGNIYFKKNTLNNIFFPESGYSLSIDTKYSFLNHTFQEIKTVFSKPNIVTEQEKGDTAISPFLRTTISFETAIPLSKHTSFTIKTHAGLLIGDKFTESGNLVGENFLLGGIEQRHSPNHFPFAGNREGVTQHTAFATAQLGVRIEVFNNIFIAPQGSILMGDNTTSTVWSTGFSLGYRTPFIPIMVSLSKASNENRWRPYYSIGYRF